MTENVSIPAEEARSLAEFLRNTDSHPDINRLAERWADLLDPQPPTLREQVANALLDVPYAWPATPDEDADLARRYADAAIAVVADWLAAQPLVASGPLYFEFTAEQRENDLSLLRGESRG